MRIAFTWTMPWVMSHWRVPSLFILTTPPSTVSQPAVLRDLPAPRHASRLLPNQIPNPKVLLENNTRTRYPRDATLAAYDPERFSMITGVVHHADGSPLENVAVTILDSPQYGTAFTDIDGRFSMPVEGGGSLVAVFNKPDYLEVHRRVLVPWNDVAEVAPINMIKPTRSTPWLHSTEIRTRLFATAVLKSRTSGEPVPAPWL